MQKTVQRVRVKLRRGAVNERKSYQGERVGGCQSTAGTLWPRTYARHHVVTSIKQQQRSAAQHYNSSSSSNGISQ